MTLERITSQLKDEYGKLKVLARRVRDDAASAGSGADGMPNFRKSFEHFRAHLYRQFALEETDGYMSQVLERLPTRSRDVETLKAEHRSLQQAAEALFAGLDRGGMSPGDLRAGVDRLLAEVARHGQTENQLLLDVFGTDIGAGD